MLTLFQKIKKIMYRYPILTLQKIQFIFFLFFLVFTFTVHAQNNPVSDASSASPTTAANMMLKDMASTEKGQVLVFISSSMPVTSLAQWFSQAQSLDATVVMRGFVNNSLLATKAWLKPLIEQTQLESSIEINPVAFEAFGITQVPAVVIAIGKLKCLSNQPCTPPPFDIVSGNTSLYEALKMMAEKGEVGITLAKQALARMKEAM